ncbi:phosphoribosylformylglycinamidine synthase subunit PurS [Alicyclobacillus contaminans]|uniref:phosphoribosylformylglycinamidine synthase subunit PurS n=1 Tax=Alicyclobacillus contaminans TaxID=392016 RepID=UPI0004223C36|nr:phosphoribosylformylglycinamidine synthase subunit PurS [Alicyclobacillus contaminans]GMA50314.1 phosphoribosylformylglycinamidine synthase subunit PurS [Alicyclobacillus contaminans]
MSLWTVEVKVSLKPSVFDPQGNAVEQALMTLGHTGVSNLRMGKTVAFHIEAPDEAAARAQVDAICRDVLCNLVIETYEFTLAEAAAVAEAAR